MVPLKEAESWQAQGQQERAATETSRRRRVSGVHREAMERRWRRRRVTVEVTRTSPNWVTKRLKTSVTSEILVSSLDLLSRQAPQQRTWGDGGLMGTAMTLNGFTRPYCAAVRSTLPPNAFQFEASSPPKSRARSSTGQSIGLVSRMYGFESRRAFVRASCSPTAPGLLPAFGNGATG